MSTKFDFVTSIKDLPGATSTHAAALRGGKALDQATGTSVGHSYWDEVKDAVAFIRSDPKKAIDIAFSTSPTLAGAVYNGGATAKKTVENASDVISLITILFAAAILVGAFAVLKH